MRFTHVLAVPLAAFALTLTWAQAPTGAPRAEAAPTPATVQAPGCYGAQNTDFNGDGDADVPVGDPHGDAGRVKDAGVVEVRYGCGALPPQRLTLPHPHRGDEFGAALAAGSWSHGYELFVGVPHLKVKGHRNAGGVAEFAESPTGLTFVKLWTVDSKGIPGKVQGGAHLGAALSLWDDNEERFYLRAGEPGLDVGSHKDAGAYIGMNWSSDSEDPVQRPWRALLSDFGVKTQKGDLFGSSFAQGTSLRVGLPGRSVDGHAGAGAILDAGHKTLVSQATPGVPGSPEKGYHFGAALSGNWIGVPGEAIGNVAGSGLVEYWDADDPTATQEVDQGTAGVPGDVGAGHHFGAAIDVGPNSDVVDQLLVGAPGDLAGAGSVTLLRPAPSGGSLSSATLLAAPVRPGGGFGATIVSSGSYHELVAAPAAEGGRVYSFALPPDGSGKPTYETSWTQLSAGSHAYGSALAGQALEA